MQFTKQSVKPTHADFLALVSELNTALSQITQDSGAGSFCASAFAPERDGCIVVYDEAKPVACGVFRYHAEQVCELKRMYSKVSGAGGYLLRELEQGAREKGYQYVVLSTRRANHKALGFYQHHHYVEAPAYGQYVGVERSICLSKRLCAVQTAGVI